MKKDNPKITFRPTWQLRRQFKRKCFNMEVSQDLVLNELISQVVYKFSNFFIGRLLLNRE